MCGISIEIFPILYFQKFEIRRRHYNIVLDRYSTACATLIAEMILAPLMEGRDPVLEAGHSLPVCSASCTDRTGSTHNGREHNLLSQN